MILTTLIFSLLGLLSLVAAIPIAEVDDLPWPVAPLRATYQLTPESEPISLEGDVLGKIAKIRARYGIVAFNNEAPKPRSEVLRRNKVCS
jgi:hypothetical protein